MKNLFALLFSLFLVTGVSYAQDSLPDKKSSKPASECVNKKSSSDKKDKGEIEGESYFKLKSHKRCFKSIIVC